MPLAEGGIEAVAALPYRGGLGIGGGMPSRLDPHRPLDPAPQLLKPNLRHRNDKSSCGEEEPKERSKRVK